MICFITSQQNLVTGMCLSFCAFKIMVLLVHSLTQWLVNNRNGCLTILVANSRPKQLQISCLVRAYLHLVFTWCKGWRMLCIRAQMTQSHLKGLTSNVNSRMRGLTTDAALILWYLAPDIRSYHFAWYKLFWHNSTNQKVCPGFLHQG